MLLESLVRSMSKSNQGTSKLTSKVSETKGFGEGDSRSILFSWSEPFLGNEFDRFFIFSGFSPFSKKVQISTFLFLQR
jgi:hypothetical protein